MEEELATNEKSIKERSKPKEYEYLLKKFDVEVKKVDEGLQSNIHQRFSVTTLKSTLDKKK